MSKVNQVISPSQPFTTCIDNSRSDCKIILGLDLGTNCGYCFGLVYKEKEEVVILPEYMGQWDLSAGPYDSGAIRFVRLRRFLNEVKPDLVAYEDVKFTPSEALTRFSAARVLARASTSAELIGAFRATVVTWCEEKDIPCTGIPIGTIKKRATGKGNASKELIIEACNKEFKTDFDIKDYATTGADNVSDAAWIVKVASEQYSSGIKW